MNLRTETGAGRIVVHKKDAHQRSGADPNLVPEGTTCLCPLCQSRSSSEITGHQHPATQRSILFRVCRCLVGDPAETSASLVGDLECRYRRSSVRAKNGSDGIRP